VLVWLVKNSVFFITAFPAMGTARIVSKGSFSLQKLAMYG